MKNSRTNLLKKLCAISLAAAMLASAGLTEAGTYIGTGISVSAAVIIGDGSCGDNVTYTLDSEGILTINGTGEIDNAAFQGNTYITSVTISDSVKSIGSEAFKYCTSLKKATIGNGVTNIGDGAFANCTNLTDVAFGSSVTSIGDYAFFYCTSLTEVKIPDSVTSIKSKTFFGCTSLKEINVDKNNKNYSSVNGVLFNKDKTTLIKYPSGKTDDKYSISNSVTSIGNRAFQYCTSLKKAEIPDSVTSIGDSAFWSCTSLKEITIGNGVTNIGDGVFANCTNLTKVKIPDSVTNIGDRAFGSCTNLTDVTIGNGVTSIERGTFDDCTNLKTITIGNSVTSIEYGAFYDCTSLKEINVDENNKNYSSVNGVLFNKDKTTLIKYPKGKADTEYSIPNSVTSIEEGTFNDCTNLKEINVDKKNKNYSSENGVFFNKDKTTLIKYPEGKADSEYSIPDSVTSIGDRAFRDCTSLTKITIGNGVISIGYYAFGDCKNLKEVTIGKAVTSIGSWAFNNCTNLKTITIGNSVTSIGYYAFYDCTRLKEVTIGSSVTSIKSKTFFGCTNLTSIIVPNSVTSIDYGAFGYIYNNFSEEYEKISNFTIYGTKGSEAENYAITNDFMFIDVSELSEQKKSDGNTNVSVYGNIPKTAKLNVKSVSTDVKNAVLAYDITLTKDNKEIEPVGEVTVSIPCDTPDLKVVWLHDGEQTDMNATYADGKYTFKVSHFSTYVLVKDGLFGKINGDTNGDGKVNIADALMIARYDAKLTTLNDAQISVSDVNGDSKVNIADALKIARYDAKLIDSLD